jgi:hypothetical protein
LCDCGTQLRSALAAVAAEGRGALSTCAEVCTAAVSTVAPSSATTRPQPLTSVPRFFATGACVLLDRPATADVSARPRPLPLGLDLERKFRVTRDVRRSVHFPNAWSEERATGIEPA